MKEMINEGKISLFFLNTSSFRSNLAIIRFEGSEGEQIICFRQIAIQAHCSSKKFIMVTK